MDRDVRKMGSQPVGDGLIDSETIVLAFMDVEPVLRRHDTRAR